jgi:FtsZ-interacting cell division protein ZipA
MDTFTIILIVVGAALVVAVVVSQIRGRRRSGHHIAQSAPMDSNNTARYVSDTNIHDRSGFGGSTGGL